MKEELKLDLNVGIKRLKILTNRLVNTKIVGSYRSVFKGRGLEFLDYRHYTPNDDASRIDWKASVRSKELLVREFADERNLNIFFLIDVGSSMIYSTTDKLKIEYAAELVATLSYTILQAGDSIGFVLFNDKVIKHEIPRTGFKQYYKLIKTLVDPSNYGGNFDLIEVLKFTIAILKEFSIVIIISDFIGLKNDWEHYLKLAGKKYDLIGIMVRDPTDRVLPDYHGQVILGDVYSSRQIMVNVDKVGDSYTKYAEAREKEISNAFIKSGADFLQLVTNEPFVKPLTDMFSKRAKRLR